jgi:hypothetical protein
MFISQEWVDAVNEIIVYNNRLGRKMKVMAYLDADRPRNISEADWRMALRRKLNGDTR